MAQKRIDFFGQFRPTGVDPTAAEKYRQLAGIGQQVTSIALQEGKRIRTEEGMQEGLKAGQEAAEAGEAIEKRSSFTFKDQAYNEGVILSYRAQVRKDAKETLNRLQNEYELDPEKFRSVADEYKKGIIQGLPEEFAFVVGGDIDNEIVNRATALDDAAFEHGRQQLIADNLAMAEDLKDDILNAVRRGDEKEAARLRAERMALMERGVQNRLIDPKVQAKDAESMVEQIAINREVGKLDRLFADPSLTIEEKIQRATEIVDTTKNKEFKDLDLSQKEALGDALQSKLNEQIRLQAEFKAQEQKQLAEETIALKLDAQLLRKDPVEIHAKAQDMFRNDQITEGEYQGILTSLAQAEAKETQNQLTISKVSERLKGDESILVSQKENDFFWDNVMENSLSGLEADDRISLSVNYVKDVGSVPSKLKARITNGLRSMDQDLIAESARIIDGIDNLRGIETPVTPHDRAFAQLVVDLTKNMEPAEALKIAREQTDPSNEARIKAREKLIKEQKYEDKYPDKVNSLFQSSAFDFGDFQGKDLINFSQMQEEYKGLFETFVKAGMDESAAEEKAGQLLVKNWSYSPSSDRMMKYPPEHYYNIQGDADYIKDQLDEFIRKETSFGITEEGYQKALLISDEQTGQLASKGTPDYLVYVLTNSGQLELVTGTDPKDGKIKPMRWSPDVKKERQRRSEEIRKGGMDIRKEALRKQRNIINMPLQSGAF